MTFKKVIAFALDPLGLFGRGNDKGGRSGAETAIDSAVTVFEKLPFDAGLIVTQSLSDPPDFLNRSAELFPAEQTRVFKSATDLIDNNPVANLTKWVVVGAVVFALFPTIFAASRRVGKVIA